MNALDPRWRPLFATAIYTSLRKCEALSMRKVDIAHGPACWIGAAWARARRFGRSRGNPKYRRVLGGYLCGGDGA